MFSFRQDQSLGQTPAKEECEFVCVCSWCVSVFMYFLWMAEGGKCFWGMDGDMWCYLYNMWARKALSNTVVTTTCYLHYQLSSLLPPSLHPSPPSLPHHPPTRLPPPTLPRTPSSQQPAEQLRCQSLRRRGIVGSWAGFGSHRRPREMDTHKISLLDDPSVCSTSNYLKPDQSIKVKKISLIKCTVAIITINKVRQIIYERVNSHMNKYSCLTRWWCVL